MIYIEFKSNRLKERLETFSECVKKYGKNNAKKVFQRLTQITSSENLEEFSKLERSARCHPLKGNREGQYAIDVIHPFRIIFEPVVDSGAFREDGSLNLEKVTRIKILDVKNYHGKTKK